MKQNLFAGEIFWWIVGAFLGAIGWGLPAFIALGASDLTQLLLSVAGIFGAGAILGYQRPERVWRWGIASVLLLPVAEGIRAESILYFLVQIPASIIPAGAAFAGAFLGMVAKKGLSATSARAGKEDRRRWWAGFATGLLCSIPYVLPPELERLNTIAAIALLFALALVLSLSFPERVWRWALAAGLSLPGMVILRALLDSLSAPGTHSLLGIEIVLAFAFALPAAFAGAYTAPLIRKIRAARDKSSIRESSMPDKNDHGNPL